MRPARPPPTRCGIEKKEPKTDAGLSSFMAHPETLLPMPSIEDPTERFLSVVKFYLSGWHIKPPYVCSARTWQRRRIWIGRKNG